MKKKLGALILCLALAVTTVFTGCGDKTETSVSETASVSETSVEEETTTATDLTVKPESGNYIQLALNVYYNDSVANYYANEAGSSIYITDEGTYTLSFDCGTDLSNDAINAGVKYLDNLTAIYLLDMGVAEGEQSALTACNIMYDSLSVDGTELTITQTEPKSAFKSSGVFDTNDPVNAWDGSLVEEVEASSDHVANFTTVTNPTTVSLTFTLSDMVWGDEEVTEETADTPAAEGSGYTNTAVFSDMDFTDMDALTLTEYLGNGINLGNTMEAYGHGTLGTKANVSSYETLWGQPVTTAAMIQGMKDCGFDTLRIPVAWTNMIAYEDGDYTIDTAYLDRVEEIVNYALDAEMFVIVNDHWDGGWFAMFGSASDDTVQMAWDLYTQMWQQIAERFKDYSDMLIFESANEEMGSGFNDNGDWPDSGTLTEDEQYELTNELNQRFVDTVRATGGNNTDRFLLIAGYNTDIEKTCDDRFKMPTDTANGKLFVSVHYYTPWNYCGADNQSKWGIKSDYETMNTLLEEMTKFTEAGYGVIIGEYAALPFNSGTELKANTKEFTENFLDNCDIYNYSSCLWSCNDLYSKYTLTMASDELTELYTSRCYAEESQDTDYLQKVQDRMAANLENAAEMWEGVETYEAGTPVAWIMWNGGAGTYSVGDTFNPADNTEGITATNTVIDGAGEYTVSLDFAGGNDGLTFAALAIADGELLYPGMYINIEEITLDGNPVTLAGTPYTSSDDGKCTRVNLYNEWVSKLPDDARALGGLTNASPCILDKTQLVGIKNITIKFRVVIMG